MNIEELKNKAVELAKEFKENEKCISKLEVQNYTIPEWWVLVNLAQVYYNLMTGKITREQAQEEQNKAIKFVQQNAHIFEEIEE
jgi:hypothetical protein